MKFEFAEDELIFSGKAKREALPAQKALPDGDLPDIPSKTAGSAPVVVDLEGSGPGGVERRKRPPRQRKPETGDKTTPGTPSVRPVRPDPKSETRPRLEVPPTPESEPKEDQRRSRRQRPSDLPPTTELPDRPAEAIGTREPAGSALGQARPNPAESRAKGEPDRPAPTSTTETESPTNPMMRLKVSPTPQEEPQAEERRAKRGLKPSNPPEAKARPERPPVDSGEGIATIPGPDAPKEERRIRRRLKPETTPSPEKDRPAILGTPQRHAPNDVRPTGTAPAGDGPAETPERKSGLASRIRAKFGGRQAPAKATKVAQTALPTNLPSVPPRLTLSDNDPGVAPQPAQQTSPANPTDAPAPQATDAETPWISAAQLAAVQASFKVASHPSARAADRFYDNLFDAHPEMEAPFLATGKRPKTMMWMTLQLLADNLAEPESLRLPMEQLGARHLALGVKDDMYAKFADILLGTIANANEADWTDAHETGWEEALGLMVTFMRDGAAKRARAKPED